jgi:hypothetical protein
MLHVDPRVRVSAFTDTRLVQGSTRTNLTEEKIAACFIFISVYMLVDRLCGLVVRVPDRSRGPGLIPSVTRFSEK